jgi:hypothetical protein
MTFPNDCVNIIFKEIYNWFDYKNLGMANKQFNEISYECVNYIQIENRWSHTHNSDLYIKNYPKYKTVKCVAIPILWDGLEVFNTAEIICVPCLHDTNYLGKIFKNHILKLCYNDLFKSNKKHIKKVSHENYFELNDKKIKFKLIEETSIDDYFCYFILES